MGRGRGLGGGRGGNARCGEASNDAAGVARTRPTPACRRRKRVVDKLRTRLAAAEREVEEIRGQVPGRIVSAEFRSSFLGVSFFFSRAVAFSKKNELKKEVS